jgi:hypothetical protein
MPFSESWDWSVVMLCLLFSSRTLPRVCFKPVSLIHFHLGTALKVRSNIVYCHSVYFLFGRDRRNVDVKMSLVYIGVLGVFPTCWSWLSIVLLVCIWRFVHFLCVVYNVAEVPHPPQVFPQCYYKFGRPFIFRKFDVLVL